VAGETSELLHHTPEWWSAAGTIVNVFLVAILAFLNWRYLKAAKRQADAAEQQTKEIKEQIALSRKQLVVMEDAFRFSISRDKTDRRNSLTIAEAELRKIQDVVTRLLYALSQPAANFGQITEDAIFPDTWIQIARTMEQELEAGDHKARVLLGSLLTTRTTFRDLIERLRTMMPQAARKDFVDAVQRQVNDSQERLPCSEPDGISFCGRFSEAIDFAISRSRLRAEWDKPPYSFSCIR
jgi:hypothetical protein